MSIKSILLVVIFSFGLIGFQSKVQALDNQQFYSRLGLTAGLLTTATGIYYSGFVSFPQQIMKAINPFVGKTKTAKRINSRLNKNSNDTYKVILFGLALTAISWKYLK